jgi:hypothetical protein
MFQKCIQPLNRPQHTIMWYLDDDVLFFDVTCHPDLLLQMLSALPLYFIERKNSDSWRTLEEKCELYERFSACRGWKIFTDLQHSLTYYYRHFKRASEIRIGGESTAVRTETDKKLSNQTMFSGKNIKSGYLCFINWDQMSSSKY